MRVFNQFILTLFVVSCNKPHMLHSVHVDIEIYNQQGQNLLAPPANLNESNIQLYLVKDGKITLFYNKDLAYPKGFIIGKFSTGQQELRIYNNDLNDELPVKILKLGDYPPDTIKSEIRKEGNSTSIYKIWHNNILKYDAFADKTTATIKIIK